MAATEVRQCKLFRQYDLYVEIPPAVQLNFQLIAWKLQCWLLLNLVGQVADWLQGSPFNLRLWREYFAVSFTIVALNMGNNVYFRWR